MVFQGRIIRVGHDGFFRMRRKGGKGHFSIHNVLLQPMDTVNISVKSERKQNSVVVDFVAMKFVETFKHISDFAYLAKIKHVVFGDGCYFGLHAFKSG